MITVLFLSVPVTCIYTAIYAQDLKLFVLSTTTSVDSENLIPRVSGPSFWHCHACPRTALNVLEPVKDSTLQLFRRFRE